MTHTFHISNILFSPAGTNKYLLMILLSLYKHTERSIHPSQMVPELEKPRVTEIHVRMDCNGCVQKIKKALHGINGIYDLNIDYPKQKLTVVGWVEPEKIIKAIKKTKKVATICSHFDPSQQPTEPPPPEAPAEATDPPPTESPPAEAAPAEEPPKDSPPPENPAPETTPPPAATETVENKPKDVEEIHVIHHHPDGHGQGYGYGNHWNPRYHSNDHGYWNNYHHEHAFQPKPPSYATHSYNAYRPSPYTSEYQYPGSPPQQTHYSRSAQYDGDYQNRNTYGNENGNNVTSMFSEENPNACRIV